MFDLVFITLNLPCIGVSVVYPWLLFRTFLKCFCFFIYVLFYVPQVSILGNFVYFLTLYTPWIIFFGLATSSTLISQNFQCRSLFEALEPHTR